MTCNVKFGKRDIRSLFKEIDHERPDLILLQDATSLLESSVGNYFREWNIRYYGQFVIASRLPLEEAEIHWLNFPGQVEQQASLRCRVTMAGTERRDVRIPRRARLCWPAGRPALRLRCAPRSSSG